MSSPRCGRIAPGSHVKVVGIDGGRAQIMIPGTHNTGWVSIQKGGRVLLGRDLDWDGHMERMQPPWESNEEMARVLERLDPQRSLVQGATRNAEMRRKREQWKQRQVDEAIKMLNLLSAEMIQTV